MNQLTWTDALGAYWLARRRDFSPHTELDYGNTFARFAAFIDDGLVDSITSNDIHAFLNEMERRHKLSRKTMSNYWTALSSFWTWAEVELGLAHIIRGRVPRPKYRRKQIHPYTHGEIKTLIESCAHFRTWRTPSGEAVNNRRPTANRDQAIIVTLVDTGIRCSELCALRVGDYDSKHHRLLIRHGKGDKERFVYLGKSVIKTVSSYLATRVSPRSSEPLFATRTHTALDRNNLRNLIRRLAERAGVRGANVHRFRHTFAVNFLRNGGNVLALQDLLGHETLDTIRIYVKLSQTDLRKIQLSASPADKWGLA